MSKPSSFILNTEFSKDSRFVIDIHTKITELDKWLLLADFYKDWLNKNHQELSKSRIPKIIHHIWLGSPLPKKYYEFMKSWKAKHPEWEFILWNDEKLNNLEMLNKKLFLKLKNYGAKSDVARLEILYKFRKRFCCYKTICYLRKKIENCTCNKIIT